MKALVVVESSAKARTLSPLLGRDYLVVSTDGPVVDLPKKRFDLSYGPVPGAKKCLAELRRAAAGKAMVFFATDPDGPGEAVAWNVAERLGVPRERLHRVLLEEVSAAGFRRVHELNVARYEAELARRAVDRTIEFHLSGLLGHPITRLQAAALRLLVTEAPEAPTVPLSGGMALIQAAAATRSFTPRRTMALAQQLYELGLITFPRGQEQVRPSTTAPAPGQAGLEPGLATIYSLIWAGVPPIMDLGPRYTHATLMAALERRGAPLACSETPGHDFVIEDGYRRLAPTELGRAVAEILEPFPNLLADDVLEEFYAAVSQVKEQPLRGMKTGISCVTCQGPLTFKWVRHKEFVFCGPCRATMSFVRLADGTLHVEQPEALDRACPTCGRAMRIRSSRFGRFASCVGYPECRVAQPLQVPKPTGASCPKCKSGAVVERTSNGKPFFTCSQYPTCRYRTKKRPTSEAP